VEVWGWLIAVIAAAGWSWTAWRLASSRRERERLDEALKRSEKVAVGLKSERQEVKAVMARREKQAESSILGANVSFSRSLLPVNDALVRALESGGDVDSYRQGVQLVHKLLEQTLCASGLSPIRPQIGDRFDPALHESIARVDNADKTKGGGWQVAKVESEGWLYRERLLRAAKVIVVSVVSADASAESDPESPAQGSDPTGVTGESIEKNPEGETVEALPVVALEKAEPLAEAPVTVKKTAKGKPRGKKRKRRHKG